MTPRRACCHMMAAPAHPSAMLPPQNYGSRSDAGGGRRGAAVWVRVERNYEGGRELRRRVRVARG